MPIKFKKPQHTPGPWRTKLNTDWISTRNQKGEEIALYSGNHGTIRFSEKEDIANASLGSAGPEMLQFIKDFIISMDMSDAERKKWQKKQVAIAYQIIDKAQNQKIPLKTYYYYIYEIGNSPTFVPESHAHSPNNKSQNIKQIQARNRDEARIKIRDAKRHIPLVIKTVTKKRR